MTNRMSLLERANQIRDALDSVSSVGECADHPDHLMDAENCARGALALLPPGAIVVIPSDRVVVLTAEEAADLLAASTPGPSRRAPSRLPPRRRRHRSRALVADLQETRRLGDQLANAVAGDVYYAGKRIEVQVDTGSAIGAAIAAWRAHQAK